MDDLAHKTSHYTNIDARFENDSEGLQRWNECWQRAKHYIAGLSQQRIVHRFSVSAYWMDGNLLDEREEVDVRLTNEQYIYLLTEVLYNEFFSFIDLVRYNPALAQEIVELITPKVDFTPTMISFDDIYIDREQIDGPLCAYSFLCGGKENNRTCVLSLAVHWRQKMKIDLEVVEQTGNGKTSGYSKSIDQIDAKAVMHLLGANNYSEMMCMIEQRFNTSNAYDDLLNYLNENHIMINKLI